MHATLLNPPVEALTGCLLGPGIGIGIGIGLDSFIPRGDSSAHQESNLFLDAHPVAMLQESTHRTMDESSILSRFDDLVRSGAVRYDENQETIRHTTGGLTVSTT